MMTKDDVYEGQRITHARYGAGTIEDTRGRNSAVVRVSLDSGETKGVWIADLTQAK